MPYTNPADKKKHYILWREDNREQYREYQNQYRKSYPEKSMYVQAKHRAKKKNLPFDLEESDIVIPDYCPILGVELLKGTGNQRSNSPSLDRIIPNLGYVKGNIQVISNRANSMKNDASLEELERFADWVKNELKPLLKT